MKVLGNVMVLGVYVLQAIGRSTYMLIRVKGVLVSKKSRYQQIDVVDTEEFGRVLVLDGLVQSAEVDEFYYHESLVHPAMVLHPNPRKVLILGGGEGATLREVLKHSTVERAVMVDIDEEVVKVSRDYLVSWHSGAFDDPRATVVIEDGRTFVEKLKEKFDVVIMDLTDPYGPEIARALYGEEFIERLHEVLADDGVLSTQAGTSFFYPEEFNELHRRLAKVFKKVASFSVWIPSFGYSCNFIVASKTRGLSEVTEYEVDQTLRARGVITKFISGKVVRALLNLPRYRKYYTE
ncbi:MAG: polyamine aminopropyltransferase [Sulfolobales archaeon]